MVTSPLPLVPIDGAILAKIPIFRKKALYGLTNTTLFDKLDILTKNAKNSEKCHKKFCFAKIVGKIEMSQPWGGARSSFKYQVETNVQASERPKIAQAADFTKPAPLPLQTNTTDMNGDFYEGYAVVESVGRTANAGSVSMVLSLANVGNVGETAMVLA